MHPRILQERLIAVVCIGIGVFFAWGASLIQVSSDAIGPQTFPFMASFGILAIGIGMLIGTFFTPVDTLGETEEDYELMLEKRREARYRFARVVLPVAVLGVVYTLLWHWVGYLIATLLLTPFWFAAMGANGLRERVVIPTIIVVILYIAFFHGLKLYYQPGELFEMLEWHTPPKGFIRWVSGLFAGTAGG